MKVLALAMLVVLMGVGCTRKTEDKSSLSFTVPQQNPFSAGSSKAQSKPGPGQRLLSVAQSADSLSHVIVNISGPGLSTILCGYDLEHGGVPSGQCDFSQFPSVHIDLSTGSDRLVQVLLAYSDGSGGMTLAYGDSTTNLTAGNQDLPIDVYKLGAATNLQGHISGRYLTSSNDGPTGTLEVKVKADSGKPSLTLMRNEMFNGWFDAFSVDGIRFEYWVNGLQLFGAPVNKADFDNLASAGKPVTVTINSDGFEVMGWFGDSTSIGSRTAMANCSTGLYTTCLDSTARRAGPFAAPKDMAVSLTNSNTLNWTALPGTSSSVDGVNIYRLFNTALQPYMTRLSVSDSLIDCDYLKTLPGVTQVGTNVTTGTYTLGSALAADESLFFCPYKGTKQYQSFFTYPSSNNNSGPSGPYLRIEFSNVSGNNQGGYTLVTGQCYPVYFKLYEGSGNPFPNPDGTSLMFSNINLPGTGSAWGSFYNGPSCSTMTSVASISPGSNSSTQFSFKPTTTGTGLSFNPSVPMITNLSMPVSFQPNYELVDVTAPILGVTGPTNINVGSCYQYNVQLQDSTGMQLMPASVITGISIKNATLLSNVTVFNSISDCVAGTPPATGIAISASPAQIYFKATAAGPFALRPQASGGYIDNGFTGVATAGSPTLSQLTVSLSSSNVGTNQCIGLMVKVLNDSGVEVPTPSPLNVTLKSGTSSSMGGAFYQNGSCSGVATDSISIPAGNSRAWIFYQAMESTAAPQIMVGNNSLGFSAPLNFAISPQANSAYISMTLPRLPSKVLGDLQFNTLSNINIALPVGANIQCEQSPDGVTGWSACSNSYFSPGSFHWDSIDAVALRRFRFTVTLGSSILTQYFDPASVYGSDFKVYACSTYPTPAGGPSGIYSALANSSVVCLAASATGGTTNTYSGTGGIVSTAFANVALIGWADPTNMSVVESMGGSYPITLSWTGASTIANIKMRWNSSGTSNGRLINVTSPASPLTLGLYNLILDLSNSNTSSHGLAFNGVSNANSITAKDIVFRFTNNDSSSGAFIVASDAQLNMERVQMQNTAAGGSNTLLEISNSGVSTSPSLMLQKVLATGGTGALLKSAGNASYPTQVTLIDVSMASSSSSAVSQPLVQVGEGINLNLSRSLLDSNRGASVIGLTNNTSALTLTDNKIVQRQTYPALSFSAPGPSLAKTFTMEGNHFIALVNTSAGPAFSVGTGYTSVDLLKLSGNAPSGTAGNRFCGNSGSGWTSIASGNLVNDAANFNPTVYASAPNIPDYSNGIGAYGFCK